MCLHKDCSAGGLIYAAALHTNYTVLNDIDDTDSVLSAELIELSDDIGNLHLFTVYALGNAGFEGHSNILTLIGSFLGGYAEYE